MWVQTLAHVNVLRLARECFDEHDCEFLIVLVHANPFVEVVSDGVLPQVEKFLE